MLRWPGGCFADEYHWKDGIGPREKRPSMINTHWGGVVEDNSFGTHEFMDLVEQLGTDAYITGNVGSGTPQEMMEWVEYMTSDAISPMANLRRQNGREKAWRLPYFGIANEPWGCGGNMRPEYYADEYRQVQHLRQELRPHEAHLPHRGRRELRGLQVDRGADERGRPADGRPVAPLLHGADGQLGARRGPRPASARTCGSGRCRRRCAWTS